MQPVVIYTTTSCVYCRSAKAWFSARGVPYTEVDVTGDDAAHRLQHHRCHFEV